MRSTKEGLLQETWIGYGMVLLKESMRVCIGSEALGQDAGFTDIGRMSTQRVGGGIATVAPEISCAG